MAQYRIFIQAMRFFSHSCESRLPVFPDFWKQQDSPYSRLLEGEQKPKINSCLFFLRDLSLLSDKRELNMPLFYLGSLWLHILAGAVWIGGMVFVALVLVPVIRLPENQSTAASLVQVTGRRFRSVGWLCLVLLLLTGAVNLFYRGFSVSELWSAELWQSPFGLVLALKLFLFCLVLALSCLHDFAIGPRATALWRKEPTSPEAGRLRRQASWIGRLNLLLALVLVALGIILARGSPW